MKALEFSTRIADNNIEIPEYIRLQLKNESKQIKVILLIQESEDSEWEKETTQQFLNGYDAADSVYDNY
ncbi:hypothetical protein AAE02nite_33300 [Adhaeribacter aerolatus]|uniref:Uncharacterized protein n=1 Tax=Adhaeribacter aerolatus TaxID=670289 RepID=A0A512B132_9BACT|nr:hypothetical protein [Adhaeribacter aerolatus]GEO05666.1 hypothetical protein AAE02nite_33300 [Adhaeribacter aerolatus]